MLIVGIILSSNKSKKLHKKNYMKFKENNPIYLQIAERICDEILQGKYQENNRIPSVREYATTVEVNTNTIVRSFDHLETLEIIYNKRDIGFFVTKGATKQISRMRKRIFLSEELPEFFRKIDSLKISINEILDKYEEWQENESFNKFSH